MLPQHLEPFNLQENHLLGIAFKKGKLPYLEDKGMRKTALNRKNITLTRRFDEKQLLSEIC